MGVRQAQVHGWQGAGPSWRPLLTSNTMIQNTSRAPAEPAEAPDAHSPRSSRTPNSDREANVDETGGKQREEQRAVQQRRIVEVAQHVASLLDESAARSGALRALPSCLELLERSRSIGLVYVAAVSAHPLALPVAHLRQRQLLLLLAAELHGGGGCPRRDAISQRRLRESEPARVFFSTEKVHKFQIPTLFLSKFQSCSIQLPVHK